MRIRRNKDEIECDGCKRLTEDVNYHPVTKQGSYCYGCYCDLEQLASQGFGGILKATQYVETLRKAYRTLHPMLERMAQELFSLLTPSEKILAVEILEATGEAK